MPDLYRLNVALVPKAETALNDLVKTTGMTRTDLVNRALQLYGWIIDKEAAGGQFSMLESNGELNRVKLF